MAGRRHGVLLAICFFAVMWTFAGLDGYRAQAQPTGPQWGDLTHCTISGWDRIYVDGDCSEGISLGYEPNYRYDLLLGYDPATKRLYPFIYDGGDGPYPMEFEGTMTLQTSTENLLEVRMQSSESAEEAVVRAERLCGATGFNRLGVLFQYDEETYVAGEGSLVDTDGDRKVDAILFAINSSTLSSKRVGQLGRALRAPVQMVMSESLSYYSEGGMNFWHIPCGGDMGEEVFVPVDGAHNLTLQCGDQTAFIPSEAFLDGDGHCLMPVPALTGWGAAGLIFLIFATGIWAMRRTGFGRGLDKKLETHDLSRGNRTRNKPNVN